MAYRDTGEFISSSNERFGQTVFGVGVFFLGAALLAFAGEVADGVFGDDIFTVFGAHEFLDESASLRDKLEVASIPGILGLIFTSMGLSSLKITYARYK